MPGNSYHCWWKGHTILERYEHKDKLISKKKRWREKTKRVNTTNYNNGIGNIKRKEEKKWSLSVESGRQNNAVQNKLRKWKWRHFSADTRKSYYCFQWASLINRVSTQSESYSANKFWIATYESWANWTDGPFTPALYSLLISFIHSFLNLCYSPDLHTVMEAQDFFPFILKWKTRFVHF